MIAFLLTAKALLFGSPLRRITSWGVIALTAYLSNNAYQRSVGAQRLATKIEQKAKTNEKLVEGVRRKSGSGASGGVLDPYNANNKR